MSLIRRAWDLIDRGVTPDVAEKELRAYQRSTKRDSKVTGAERMRRERQETVERSGPRRDTRACGVRAPASAHGVGSRTAT